MTAGQTSNKSTSYRWRPGRLKFRCHSSEATRPQITSYLSRNEAAGHRKGTEPTQSQTGSPRGTSVWTQVCLCGSNNSRQDPDTWKEPVHLKTLRNKTWHGNRTMFQDRIDHFVHCTCRLVCLSLLCKYWMRVDFYCWCTCYDLQQCNFMCSAFSPAGGRDHWCSLASVAQLPRLECLDRLSVFNWLYSAAWAAFKKVSVAQHHCEYKKEGNWEEVDERNAADWDDKSGNDDCYKNLFDPVYFLN